MVDDPERVLIDVALHSVGLVHHAAKLLHPEKHADEVLIYIYI